MSLFLPSIAVGIIFLIVLALGGFWPFGKATVDYYDMAQWAYPFYYHNFDELLGQKSFLFDWYTNLGRVIPGLNEPSPFDLLFLFIPRTKILEWMSILMLIKIMAMAFTMNLLIDSIKHDLPYVFRLMLAGGYGMCGFVLINYTVPMWLDMAVFVPLILMFSQKALNTGKFAPLTITVFLVMLDDYYFTIQTLIFIFLIGGAYLVYRRFTDDPKETGNLYVLRFAAGIVLAVALSAFSWIPDIANGMTSARFANGTTEGGIIKTYLETIAQVSPAYMARWFSLLSLSFPAALLLADCRAAVVKKRFAGMIFAAVCIMMAASQLFLESIHLLLHFLSYVNYPMRNGFMIYCITACFAAGLYDKDMHPAGTRSGALKTAAIAVLTAAAIIAFHIWYTAHPGFSDHFIMLLTMGIMTVLCIADLILIMAAGGRYSRAVIFLWAAELAVFGIIMIGKPLYESGYANDPEQEGEYIRIADQLAEGFGDDLATGEDAALSRIKNPDTSLNANYGVVLRRETLSGWTNLATADQIKGAIDNGYSSQFTRILDAGGNIFSDTMLHITDIISFEELDERLYEKVSETDAVIDHMTGRTMRYYLYRNRFTMPFAIPVTGIIDTTDQKTISDTINAYAKAMGAKGDIASVVDEGSAGVSVDRTDETGGAGISEQRYDISVRGCKALYLKGNCVDTDYYNTRIYVNDKPVPIPSIKEYDNELYPAHFNNNSVELGTFSDENVSIKVTMDVSDPEKVFEYYLYEIDIDELSALCDAMPKDIKVGRQKRGLEIDAPLSADTYKGLLVPVPYNSGWSARSGKDELAVSDAGGLMMYVETGNNEQIEMSYFPTYMLQGLIVAAAALICFTALYIFDKKHTVKTSKADLVLSYAYMAGFLAASLVIYVIPLVYAVFSVI